MHRTPSGVGFSRPATQLASPLGFEPLEARSLFSAYVYHDALSALGVPSVIAENGAPFLPGGSYTGYGHTGVGLGDLDGDGFADYAVSAPHLPTDAGGTAPGTVFVRSGRTGDILLTLSDGALGFGVSLANMGDLNADGRDDLAVGSPWFDGNANAAFDPAGRAWVYSGADGAVLAAFDGSAAFDEFGAAIAAVADRDNDGFRDLLVGAPNAGENRAGQAYLFSTLGFAVLGLYEGEQEGERFGVAVAAATDGTVVIGAPFHDSLSVDAGRALIYNTDNSLRGSVVGLAAGDQLGASVAVVDVIFGTAIEPALVAGAPGADLPGVGGPGYTDRGVVAAARLSDARSEGWYFGPAIAGARFGSVVAAVGDLNVDGAVDFGVAAPGAGADGEASFFGLGVGSFGWLTTGMGDGVTGVPTVPGAPGVGLAGIGDINNDGFPDVLMGNARDAVQVVAAYALGGPMAVDGASQNLRFAWSDRNDRRFLIIDGEVRTYDRIPGLVTAAPGDDAAPRSRIEAISNDGVIAFRNLPSADAFPGELLFLRDGVVTPLRDLVTAVEGGQPPDFDALTLVTFYSPDFMLLSGSGGWVLRYGVLLMVQVGLPVDMNASGTVVGRLPAEGGSIGAMWSPAAGVTLLHGFMFALAINDNGVVAGVLSGTTSFQNPGHLGLWENGVVAPLGEPVGDVPTSTVPSHWIARGFSNDLTLLADVATNAYRGPGIYRTFVAEPGTGLRRLADATHRIMAPIGFWDTGPAVEPRRGPGFVLADTGDILAYNAVLRRVSDETPYILRADSPTVSLSAPSAQYFAGVSQYGELVLFRETADGWRHERLRTDLVTASNTNLVMFVNPHDNQAYLVLADNGRMDIFPLERPGVGYDDIHIYDRPVEQLPIVDTLTVLTSTEGRVHLVGFAPNGDLVTYFLHSPGADPFNPGSWTFDNISQTHLAARGLSTPEFTSELTTFATPWGTMHVAGLDASGHVQVVWWAPDSPLWRLDDLTTDAVDARDMIGRVSAFVTPWSTLHINGVDEQGRVVALWWAPGFSSWRVDQLAPGGSLQLVADSITSYVTPWGGLNIVGRDAVNGRATAYWWAPESGVWSVEVLRVTGNVQGPRLGGPVAASASAAGALNVFARGIDGHATRLWWEPGDAGIWSVDDLSVVG